MALLPSRSLSDLHRNIFTNKNTNTNISFNNTFLCCFLYRIQLQIFSNKVYHFFFFFFFYRGIKQRSPKLFQCQICGDPIKSTADLCLCSKTLNPGYYFVRQRTELSFVADLHCWTIRNLYTGTPHRPEQCFNAVNICMQAGKVR